MCLGANHQTTEMRSMNCNTLVSGAEWTVDVAMQSGPGTSGSFRHDHRDRRCGARLPRTPLGLQPLVSSVALVLLFGFVALAGPAEAQPAGGEVRRGEEVFQASCAMCHGSDAAGMMGMHPSLRGAVERLSAEGVEVTIRKGRRTMPPMPAFEDRLSDQAIADVMAYLASLPQGPRNFGPGRDGMEGMMGGEDTTDGGVAAGLAGALLVLVLALAGLVVLMVRQRRSSGTGDARSVLDRRYAAGEVTRDEYFERRRDLDT